MVSIISIDQDFGQFVSPGVNVTGLSNLEDREET